MLTTAIAAMLLLVWSHRCLTGPSCSFWLRAPHSQCCSKGPWQTLLLEVP